MIYMKQADREQQVAVRDEHRQSLRPGGLRGELLEAPEGRRERRGGEGLS